VAGFGALLNPALDLQQIFVGHAFGGQGQIHQHQEAVAVGVQREHLELVAGGQHTRADQRLAHHAEQLFAPQDAPTLARRNQRQRGVAKRLARSRQPTLARCVGFLGLQPAHE